MKKPIFLVQFILIIASQLFAQSWHADNFHKGEIYDFQYNAASSELYALPIDVETGLAKITKANSKVNIGFERNKITYSVPTEIGVYDYLIPAGMSMDNSGNLIIAMGDQTSPKMSTVYKRSAAGNWSIIKQDNSTILYLRGKDNFIVMNTSDDNWEEHTKLSTDFGDSWLDASYKPGIITSVEKNPINPLNVFIGSMWGLFRSNDGGLTVADTLLKDQYIKDLMFYKTGNNSYRLLASVGSDPSAPASIWGSDDNGNTWSEINNGSGPQTLAYGKNNTELIGAGGLNGLLLSTDGGVTWSSHPIIIPGSSYPDFVAKASYVSSPFNSYMTSCVVGGLYSSSNLTEWEELSIPQGTLNDLEIQDADNMYAAISGALYKKTNGIWSPKQLNAWYNFYKVKSRPDNKDIVFATSRNQSMMNPKGMILKSTDAGETWREMYSHEVVYGPTDIEINPLNNDEMYVAMGMSFASGIGISLQKSTDGGDTWFPAISDSFFVANQVELDPSNPNIVYVLGDPPAFGEYKKIIKSTDAGATWNTVSMDNEFDMHKVFHISSNNDMFYSSKSGLYKSTDNGTTWLKVLYRYAWDLAEDKNTNMLYVIAQPNGNPEDPDLGGLFYSTDNGYTWTENLSIKVDNGVYTYSKIGVLPDGANSKIYVSGYGAGLFFSDMVTGIKNSDPINKYDFTLKQNYPNPFNPSTTIEYMLNRESKVRVVVYDILGNEIKKLMDEVKPSGSYTLLWDGSDNNNRKVSSGVYFYRITSDIGSDQKKMIMLK